MKNLKIDVKGSIMTITCDISDKGEISKSGKSMVIASTQGNQSVGTGKGADVVKVGVNIYRSV